MYLYIVISFSLKIVESLKYPKFKSHLQAKKERHLVNLDGRNIMIINRLKA